MRCCIVGRKEAGGVCDNDTLKLYPPSPLPALSSVLPTYLNLRSSSTTTSSSTMIYSFDEAHGQLFYVPDPSA